MRILGIYICVVGIGAIFIYLIFGVQDRLERIATAIEALRVESEGKTNGDK